MSPIKFLIVDNQPIYREALENILRNEYLTAHIYSENEYSKILEIIRSGNIDFVITDVSLEDFDGFKLTKHIISNGYHGKILFISSRNETSLARVARDNGAHGFIAKNEDAKTVLDTIANILKGYYVFKSPNTDKNKEIKLSNQETIVLHYLSRGYSNKMISEQLSLSAKTVSTYKSRILKKYEANTLTELLTTFSGTLSPGLLG